MIHNTQLNHSTHVLCSPASGHPALLTNRAQALLRLSRHDEALADARQSVALQPDWTKVCTPIGHIQHHT